MFENEPKGDLNIQDSIHTLFGSTYPNRGDSKQLISRDGNTLIELFFSGKWEIHARSIVNATGVVLIEENYRIEPNGNYIEGNKRVDWEAHLVGKADLERLLADREKFVDLEDESVAALFDDRFLTIHYTQDPTDTNKAPLTIIKKPGEDSFGVVVKCSRRSAGTMLSVPLDSEEGVVITDGAISAHCWRRPNTDIFSVTLHEKIRHSETPLILNMITLKLR